MIVSDSITIQGVEKVGWIGERHGLQHQRRGRHILSGLHLLQPGGGPRPMLFKQCFQFQHRNYEPRCFSGVRDLSVVDRRRV